MERGARSAITSGAPVTQLTGSAQVNNTRVGLLADNTCYPPHTVYNHRGSERYNLSPQVMRSGSSKETGADMLTNDYRTPLPSGQDHYCERFALTPEDVFRSGPGNNTEIGVMTNNYRTPIQSDIDHYCEKLALSPERHPERNREVRCRGRGTLQKLAPAVRKRRSRWVTTESPESSSEDEYAAKSRHGRRPRANENLKFLPKRRKNSNEQERMKQDLPHKHALEDKVAELEAATVVSACKTRLGPFPQDTIVVDSSCITAPTATGPQTLTDTTRVHRSVGLAEKAHRASVKLSLNAIAAISVKVDDGASNLDAEVSRLTKEAAELEKSARKLRDDAKNLKMRAREKSQPGRPSTPELSDLSELDSSEFEELLRHPHPIQICQIDQRPYSSTSEPGHNEQ